MIGSEAQKGNVLTIPQSIAQTGAAITAAVADPANSDVTQTSTSLTIGTHWGTRFHLTDQELTQIDADETFVPLQMSEAFKVLGNKVDTDLLGLFTDIYSGGGTAGTTPFASDASAWMTGTRKIMRTALAPNGPIHIVADEAAYANAASLAILQSAERRGSDQTIQTAQIGNALGANWIENQNVPTHTKGTLLASPLVNQADVAIGDKTVDIDKSTLTGTVVVGDIFTVAGDSQQYTITALATASSNAIAGMAFTPGAKVAWADNAVLTFVATHVANMAFHPQAFGVAFAHPEQSSMVEAGPTLVMVDPVTGIPIRLKVREQYYQTTWYLDILFGVATVRPEYAGRIFG
jgi:hypothetical protein